MFKYIDWLYMYRILILTSNRKETKMSKLSQKVKSLSFMSVFVILFAVLFYTGYAGSATVDSSDGKVISTFNRGELIDLKCKSVTGKKTWVLLQLPSLYPGVEFARPSDLYCEQQNRYVFPTAVGVEDLYYAESLNETIIDFGSNDFSGLGEILITIKAGASPQEWETVQKIRLIESDGTHFGGAWKGQVINTSEYDNWNDSCGNLNVNITIENYKITGVAKDNWGSAFAVTGMLNTDGTVTAGMATSSGDAFATFSGSFSEESGSGLWRQTYGCHGTWELTRDESEQG